VTLRTGIPGCRLATRAIVPHPCRARDQTKNGDGTYARHVRRVCHPRLVNSDARKTARDLAVVIADELSAQLGVRRDPDKIPLLIADAILDYFHVSLRPEAELPSEDNDLATYEVRTKI